MSLSQTTLLKAQKIVQKNMVAKIDDRFYQVQSSNGTTVYMVDTKDPQHGYYCDCLGWKNKFPHDCKHCEAVRIYKNEVEKN